MSLRARDGGRVVRLRHHASDFCLPTVDGATVCLRDLLGAGPVLLWFSRGHRCVHDRLTLARLRDMHQILTQRHVRVVVISPDPAPVAEQYLDELGLPFLLLVDESRAVFLAYGAVEGEELRPAAYLMGPRGRLAWIHTGIAPEDQPDLARIGKVLAGGHRFPVPSPSEVVTPAFAVSIAVVFGLLGLLASQANLRLVPWDEPIRDWIRGIGGSRTATSMEWITRLGSRWLILGLTIPMAFVGWRRCRQIVVVLIVALPAALLLELALKGLVDRPRPPLGQGFGASFPSGHVLGATAFWGLLPPWIYLVSKRRDAWLASVIGASVILVLVGVSRVFLGAHWPSDVAAGYLIGAIFLLAAEWLVRRPIASLHCRACEFHPLRSLIHHERDAVKTSG